jgi:hypothetical protein
MPYALAKTALQLPTVLAQKIAMHSTDREEPKRSH